MTTKVRPVKAKAKAAPNLYVILMIEDFDEKVIGPFRSRDEADAWGRMVFPHSRGWQINPINLPDLTD